MTGRHPDRIPHANSRQACSLLVSLVACAVAPWPFVGVAVAQPPAASRGAAPRKQADPAADETARKASLVVESRLKMAEQFRQAGDADKALEELRQASSLIKKAKGNDHPDLLPILDLAAQILVENGRLSEAEPPLQKAVAIRERLIAAGKGNQAIEIGSSLLMLGKVHASAGHLDRVFDVLKKAVFTFDSALGPENETTLEARKELLRAASIFEERLGPEHAATLKAQAELAAVHRALGDYQAARELLQKVVDAAASMQGDGDPRVLSLKTELADVLALGGRWEEAVELLSKAIDAAESAAMSPAELVPALKRLGELHLALDDVTPAAESFQQALDIDLVEQAAIFERQIAAESGDLDETDAARSRVRGETVDVCIDRMLLWRVAQRSGAFDPADAAFARTIERLEVLAAEANPRAAHGLRLAGGVLLDNGEPVRAVAIYQKAIAADEKMLDDGHPDIALDQIGLGDCMLANGDTKAAKTFFSQALRSLQKSLGPSDMRTLTAIGRMAGCTTRMKDAAESAALVSRLLERRVPWQGDKAEDDLARLVDEVAALLEGAGRREQAAELRVKLIELRERQFGEDGMRVAGVYIALANARQSVGQWGDAIALFERGIAIQEKTLGPGHPDIAAALLPLARAQRAVKDNASAEATLRRSLDIWEQTVGPDHEVTLATLKQLSLVLLALGRSADAAPLMERLLAAYDAGTSASAAEIEKLLSKLVEVHHGLGDDATAQKYLERLVGLAAAVENSVPSADNAVNLAEIARIQRLVGDEAEADASLAAARAMAAKMADSQEQMRRVNATAKGSAVRQAEAAEVAVKPAASAVADMEAARSSDPVEAAWRAYRAGKQEEARKIVADAAAELERTKGGEEKSMADLLVAAADMRAKPLDFDASTRQYRSAATIRAKSLGVGHPQTLLATLRQADLSQARGDRNTASKLISLVRSKAAAVTAASATRADLAALRDAARQSLWIALAARDTGNAVQLVDVLAALVNPSDATAVVEALELLADVDVLPRGATMTASLRQRLLSLVGGGAADSQASAASSQANRLLFHRALAAKQAGDLQAADATLRRVVESDERLLGATHPRLAIDLIQRSEVRRLLEDDAGAAAFLKAAAAAAERPPGRPPAEWLDDARRLAAIYAERGQLEDSLAVLRGAIETETKASGPTSSAVARLLADSARVYRLRGKPDRAGELFGESVAMAVPLLGGGHALALVPAMLLDRLNRGGSEPEDDQPPPAATAAGRGGRPAKAASPERSASPETGERPARPPAKAAPDSMAGEASVAAADQPLPGEDQGGASPEEDDRAALRAMLNSRRKKRGPAKGIDALVERVISSAATAAAEKAAAKKLPAEKVAEPKAGGATDLAAVPPKKPLSNAEPRQAAAAAPPPTAEATIEATAEAKKPGTPAAQTQADTVESLTRAGWELHQAGNAVASRKAFARAVALAEKRDGEAGPSVAAVLDRAAAAAIEQGDLAGAAGMLKRMGKICWKQSGPRSIAVADASARLGSVLVQCGDLAYARTLADRAFSIRSSQGGDDIETAESVLLGAAVDEAEGNASAAALRLADVRARLDGLIARLPAQPSPSPAGGPPITSTADPEQAARILAVSVATARLSARIGDFSAAEADLERLQPLVDRGIGGSEMLEEVLAVLVDVWLSTGESSAAVSTASRLAALSKQEHGAGHPREAVQVARLARAERQAGIGSWRSTAERAAAVLLQRMESMSADAGDPECIAALRWLAEALADGGAVDAGLRLATAAREAAERALPPGHEEVQRTLAVEGRLLLAAGRPAEAEPLFERAGAAAAARRSAAGAPVAERAARWISAAGPAADRRDQLESSIGILNGLTGAIPIEVRRAIGDLERLYREARDSVRADRLRAAGDAGVKTAAGK